MQSLKQRTMKLTGWTSSQYDKEYDKLRNKTRTYEKAIGSSRKRNVSQILYYTQKAQRAGQRISAERQAILSAPSASSGKPVSSRALARIQQQEFKRYEGLIENNPAFQKISDDERLTPEQKLSVMRKLADKLTASRTAAREHNRQIVEGNERIYDFYVVGSDDDMSEDLDELYAEMGVEMGQYDFDEYI